MHIAEEGEKDSSFQPWLTPIRKAVQPPFDLLNYTQNTEARLERRNRLLQKKARGVHTTTQFEGKKDSHRPAQSTKTCHASSLLFLSLTTSHSLSQRFRGERKAFVAVTAPHENFTGM